MQQINARDVLHTDEVLALDTTYFVGLDDRIVVQLDGQRPFSHKHLEVLFVFGQGLAHDLDRNQSFLSPWPREVDLGHPSFANAAEEDVFPKHFRLDFIFFHSASLGCLKLFRVLGRARRD
jgi:hypothetical protein